MVFRIAASQVSFTARWPYTLPPLAYLRAKGEEGCREGGETMFRFALNIGYVFKLSGLQSVTHDVVTAPLTPLSL